MEYPGQLWGALVDSLWYFPFPNVPFSWEARKRQTTAGDALVGQPLIRLGSPKQLIPTVCTLSLDQLLNPRCFPTFASPSEIYTTLPPYLPVSKDNDPSVFQPTSPNNSLELYCHGSPPEQPYCLFITPSATCGTSNPCERRACNA